MNSLTKVQALMAGCVILLFASLVWQLLLLVPAAALFLLQFPVMKGELKRDYPEDWIKYSLVFILYELVMVVMLYVILTMRASIFSISSVFSILIAMLFVVILTLALKFFVNRRHCYGTVLFSTKGWVGVRVKSDLFSKLPEANYAVENPLEVGVKKGDRVRIRVKSSFGKTAPYELEEVIK